MTTVLTLARPDKLNALDERLVDELIAAFDEAARDGTRLCVIRGQGKGFSGGFDFSDLERQTDGDLALRFLRVETMLQRIHHAPFVTMALVHGACFGAAADVVAACTHRVASSGATFRMPGLRFGIALGTRRLAELIGRDAAFDMLQTSKVIDANRALADGLLTRIEEQDAWPQLIDEAAKAAAVLPPSSLHRLLDLTRQDQRDADLAALARSVTEPGLKSRIAAYLASLKRS
ncbi:MAG: enoyl-CoA hydratase/isomerase family protein [Hyphomicrobiaceae bacterium]